MIVFKNSVTGDTFLWGWASGEEKGDSALPQCDIERVLSPLSSATCPPSSPLCGSVKVALARSPSEVASSACWSKHCYAVGRVTVGDVGGLCGASVVAACHAVCRRCPGSEYVNCRSSRLLQIFAGLFSTCKSPVVAHIFARCCLKIAWSL